MTSESTRFLGQPSETKPTLGRVWAGVFWFRSSRIARGVTDFYFSKFARLERLRETSWERTPIMAVKAALGTAVTKLWTKKRCRGGPEVRVRLFGALLMLYQSGLAGVCGDAITFLRDFRFFLGFSGYGSGLPLRHRFDLTPGQSAELPRSSLRCRRRAAGSARSAARGHTLRHCGSQPR